MNKRFAGLLVVTLLVLTPWGVAGRVTAEQVCSGCNLTQYGVQPRVNGSYYGVSGNNTTTDPLVCDDTVYGESAFVNSIYVYKDNYNGVELGWVERLDYGRQFFGVRVKNGVYEERYFGSVSPNTNHSYKLVSEVVPGGDRQWKYYVDGSLKHTWFHIYEVGGTIAAAQERHSRQDSGQTHWWNLKYANYSRVFSPWPNWSYVYDNDPDYRDCKVSNTEFWVKMSCS